MITSIPCEICKADIGIELACYVGEGEDIIRVCPVCCEEFELHTENAEQEDLDDEG